MCTRTDTYGHQKIFSLAAVCALFVSHTEQQLRAAPCELKEFGAFGKIRGDFLHQNPARNCFAKVALSKSAALRSAVNHGSFAKTHYFNREHFRGRLRTPVDL